MQRPLWLQITKPSGKIICEGPRTWRQCLATQIRKKTSSHHFLFICGVGESCFSLSIIPFILSQFLLRRNGFPKSSITALSAFGHCHFQCPLLVLSKKHGGLACPWWPRPHFSDLGGCQRRNKYLSLNLSVAFQKFSLKMDDGNKTGHNVQES